MSVLAAAQRNVPPACSCAMQVNVLLPATSSYISSVTTPGALTSSPRRDCLNIPRSAPSVVNLERYRLFLDRRAGVPPSVASVAFFRSAAGAGGGGVHSKGAAAAAAAALSRFVVFKHYTILRYRLTGEMTTAREISDEGRYEIAAEAVSIYDRLRPGSRPKEAVRVDMREHVGKLIDRSDLAELHKFVVKHGVIDEVIDLLVTREETEEYGFDGDMEWKIRRPFSLEAINSLIQRHRRDDEKWKEVDVEMRKMFKLVKKYNMDVSLIVLREPGMRPNLLHRFMKRCAVADEKEKLRECLNLTEVLGMTHDEAFLALLEYSMPVCNQKMEKREEPIDLDSGLYLARKALLDAKSVQLLQHVVHVAEQVIRRMIPLTPTSQMSMEDCEKAANDADILDVLFPAVLRLDIDMMVSCRVFRMNRAIRFIREAVQQMQQGSNDCSSQKEAESRVQKNKTTTKNGSNSTMRREDTLIGLPNRRRIGIYESSMDNPIMDTADTMHAVCGVAFMMHERPDPSKNEEVARVVEDMEERWAELFSDLNLAGQHLLEMHARVLYAVWGGRVEEEHVLLPLTGSFAERLASAHPCDLPLHATIFATLDEQSNMEPLDRLFLWADGQGNLFQE